MSEFMYVYRGPERSGSPAEMQAQMQKWMAWMKQLGEKGHIKDIGSPLESTGKVVKNNPKSVIDGPYAETKDVVCGFTIVTAKDLAQAVELSWGCPILETGGLVEVRPVMQMNM
jgi:hypothetical protein